MIARVAESCFWLHRYVERVDNTARLMEVNFAFVLDVPSSVVERWRPLLTVSGVEDGYAASVGAEHVEEGDRVQDYLVWSDANPFSAMSSLRAARENARTIRETLSLESWTVLNRFWLWMLDPATRRLYDAQRPAFYERMRESCHLFHGVCHDTLLHEQAFEFMRLGMFLERAGQTSRILDTKYHALGPTPESGETPLELAEWIAILRSCSGYEPFFKRSNGAMSGDAVAKFLLLDPSFPRSVLHCLLRASNFLELIDRGQPGGKGKRSARQLADLLARVRRLNPHDFSEANLHELLTGISEDLDAVCEALEYDYFGRMPPNGGSADAHRTESVIVHEAAKPATDARILRVSHETIYAYDSAVRRSTHMFRLRPVSDERQEVLDYELTLSVDGERKEFEDVFGNRAMLFRPSREFGELRILSQARVRVLGAAESARVLGASSRVRHPVVWMPWQRMMMLPYLMPPELPEPQLNELSTFALGFLRGHSGDLVHALQEMNQAIHSDFAYLPGTTSVETTPFETYVTRRGVCQDFAYLFMTLAQLLNVPARYRVGYIYTGGAYEGQVRSDATHAWAELYLPEIGWYGFDPANGKVTEHVDYVRVATGRHYRDAAPVSGTIFEGGGGETLTAAVQVDTLS